MDLTWVIPAAARLAQNWRVAEDLETSDHLYIEMEVFSAPREFLSRRRVREVQVRRWVLKKLDDDRLAVALQVLSWSEEDQTEWELERKIDRFRDRLIQVCDFVMPRAGSRSRRSSYW